jgi:hypothetical protein
LLPLLVLLLLFHADILLSTEVSWLRGEVHYEFAAYCKGDLHPGLYVLRLTALVRGAHAARSG